ncbi:NUDIX domain-containing protein [Actinotalea sp. C106]|uniref:NUDIX domain-containing protein n=1 Tax=Actinotalea sp. C106 TaxID=2908644 RepID=UPI0027E038F3|nr:NUDIX domain-containing protein [Actinotalea sp. C106]
MTVHVVAGALVADDQVLLGLRSASRSSFPGVWDLPGGHVEAGESSRAALDRELREELGVVVQVAHGPEGIRLANSGVAGDLVLDVWRVSVWAGTPENAAPDEHDELRWFTAAQLASVSLAHPSYVGLLSRVLGRSAGRASTSPPG